MPTTAQQIADFRGQSTYKKGVQHGYKKNPACASAFCAVPKWCAEAIGFRTHVGCRLECACLGRFLYEAKRNADGDQTISYRSGDTVEAGDGVFVLSMQTVAEDLFQRWFQQATDCLSFSTFYERVKVSIKRLVDKGYVRKLGYVGSNAALGTWWSFEESKLEGAPELSPRLPASSTFFLRSEIPDAKDLPEGHVNAVDLVGSVFANEKCDTHTLCEISVSLRTGEADRHRYHDFQEWHAAIAESPTDGERHASIGATKQDYRRRGDQTFYVPWLVLDFDRDDPLEAVNSAKRAIEEIHEAGIPLTHFCACPTGGSGIHIQIPMGLFGNPVFTSREKTKRALRELADSLTEETVDQGLFDPHHLYRLAGSRHPSGGGWKRAFSAKVFLGMKAGEILGSVREPHPHDNWPDPRKVKCRPNLALLMASAGDRASMIRLPTREEAKAMREGGDGKKFQAACEGVGEGDVWFEEGEEVLQGRNRAMHACSLSLLNREDTDGNAWARLEEINQRNSPPLPLSELRGCFKSAQRFIHNNS